MTFSKIEDTPYAREQANNLKLDESLIFVDYENSHNMKNWVPRRLGWCCIDDSVKIQIMSSTIDLYNDMTYSIDSIIQLEIFLHECI